jgi:predicted alpha-1,2-mannosidase
VSGTGGGQKYGNILIQPYLEGEYDQDEARKYTWRTYPQRRMSEEISLGYYSTTYDNGIRTEITTADRCALYRITYPSRDSSHAPHLYIDCTHFLGKDSIPNLRERQQFVDARLEVVNEKEVRGYSSVRGGWNNGDTYTVYFYLHASEPFTVLPPLSNSTVSRGEATTDKTADKTADLRFSSHQVNIKIGISYISTEQAKKNIVVNDFNQQLESLRQTWEHHLCKVQIYGLPKLKTMFYTAIYHTMLMPVEKTENLSYTYYDDYYAIWDTYRTSSPLLTIIDPQRQVDIVNSLLNIYKHDGYLPDARSGDCNGRTQGGSNAEVVIADAMVKDLKGIDYELALEAMLKDATIPPLDDEKEGRGGLKEYKSLGYIPYRIDRAGNRTIEYAFDDYCIAVVAKRLGKKDIYQQYLKQSQNWKNLWRKDYEWDGMKGFVMPKDAHGRWMDSVPWGHSKVFHPTIPYTPVTKVAPWYLPWWSTFFYEATSEEYSLSIPHDVEGLIRACGGKKKFRQRLDNFFEKGYYNVQNEPSFLTPCLYHWINRPDLSTQRIHQIVRDHYSDAPDGLPGNDDSGAMSSWLAFHMMGLYPNAGHDYYLLNLPMVSEYHFTFDNGRMLQVKVQDVKGQLYSDSLFSPFTLHPTQFTVSLNGKRLKDYRLKHADLMQGGNLVFTITKIGQGNRFQRSAPIVKGREKKKSNPMREYAISYTLNRQFRTWPLLFTWDGDTLEVMCKQTFYRIPRHQVEHANGFSWLTPQTDGTEYHNVTGTFAFISSDALNELKETGSFKYDQITWRKVDESNGLIHVKADIDLTEMWIQDTPSLPLVMEMKNNPLGIDWKIRKYEE